MLSNLFAMLSPSAVDVANAAHFLGFNKGVVWVVQEPACRDRLEIIDPSTQRVGVYCMSERRGIYCRHAEDSVNECPYKSKP